MQDNTKLQCPRFFKSFNPKLIYTFKTSTRNGWQPLHQQDFHTQPSETLQLLSSRQMSPAFINNDNINNDNYNGDTSIIQIKNVATLLKLYIFVKVQVGSEVLYVLLGTIILESPRSYRLFSQK